MAKRLEPTLIPDDVAATFAAAAERAGLSPGEAASATLHPPASPENTVPDLPTWSADDPPYAEVSVLGRGGMGVVVAAHDKVLDRSVALKRSLRPDPRLARALVGEARVLAALAHPNVVPVYALARDAEGPVLVMKRVEGTPWGDLPRDEDRDLEIVLHVCDALRFAHARGFLHRDLKPDNVMVGAFGEVYLMDWGCAAARPWRTSDVVGTPHYVAPEMLEVGAELSTATDVFLLAATWYRLVTGQPRHRGRAVLDVLTNAWACLPPRFGEDVPAELAALLTAATARDTADRFPTVEAFADAVRAWRTHRNAAARAHRAAGRLPALRAALAAGDPASEDVLAEVRFACRSALEDHPTCAEAHQTLHAAVDAAWPSRVASGAFEAARALVADLPEDRRDAVRAVVEAARADRARADAAGRDADLAVGSAARGRAVGAALFAGTVVLWSTELARFGRPLTLGELVVASAVAWLIAAVPLLGLRARLGNRVSRNIADGLVLATTASLVARTIGWAAGHDPAHTLGAEALTVGATLATLGLATDPRIAFGALGYGGAAALIPLWPTAATTLYAGAIQWSFVVLFLVVRAPR